VSLGFFFGIVYLQVTYKIGCSVLIGRRTR